MDSDRQMLLETYRRMVRIRQFELAATNLFKRGQLKGTVHTYIGMEASGVGVCMALRTDDLIAGTHRSHGHNIAKGADIRRMMAELLGKETGYCKGRGGSMHIAAFETGSLGALAVVASGIPLAVGAALAFQMRGEDRVAVPFTGDAGSNTGNWHEGLNMASAWNLPVVFVLENNQFAMSLPWSRSTIEPSIAVKASAYGIAGVDVDGQDVMAVRAAAGVAVERARRGDGPTLLGAATYRFLGHSRADPSAYRDKIEEERWKQRDPVVLARRALAVAGAADEAELEALETAIARELDAAVAEAEASPPATVDEAIAGMYATPIGGMR